MKRSSFWLALLLAAVLAACGGGAGTPAPAAPPTSAPSASSGQPPTVQSDEATPTTAPQTETATEVVPTPDIQKIVNAQPDDWKLGPGDAKVTIIEWGDFQ